MAKTLADFKAAHDPETIITQLRAELTEARSRASLEDSLMALIGNAAESAKLAKPPEWTIKPQADHGSPGVPTLFLSDLHWGEVVDPEQVNGMNAYDLAIARKRLRHTVETAIKLCAILDGKMRYPGVVVALGGDGVSGNLHDELTATNEQSIMPVVLDLFEHLAAAIKAMADAFGKVFLPCVSGNHGRDTRKTWSKDRNYTSFDWLIYQFLSRHFAGDKRITFYIPAGSDAHFRIYQTRYLLTHGDQFKAGDSIIGPLGPLARGRQKKLARDASVGKEWDVMLAGHFHTYIHMPSMIVNGSLKSADEWSMQQNFPYEPAQQALWITHPRYGQTFRMPVLAEPPAKALKADWISV